MLAFVSVAVPSRSTTLQKQSAKIATTLGNTAHEYGGKIHPSTVSSGVHSCHRRPSYGAELHVGDGR